MKLYIASLEHPFDGRRRVELISKDPELCKIAHSSKNNEIEMFTENQIKEAIEEFRQIDSQIRKSYDSEEECKRHNDAWNTMIKKLGYGRK